MFLSAFVQKHRNSAAIDRLEHCVSQFPETFIMQGFDRFQITIASNPVEAVILEYERTVKKDSKESILLFIFCWRLYWNEMLLALKMYSIVFKDHSKCFKIYLYFLFNAKMYCPNLVSRHSNRICRRHYFSESIKYTLSRYYYCRPHGYGRKQKKRPRLKDHMHLNAAASMVGKRSPTSRTEPSVIHTFSLVQCLFSFILS